MNVKTLFIFFTVITVTLLVSFVVEANRNEAEAATLSLSCVPSSSTSSSITVRYSYSSSESVTLHVDGVRRATFSPGRQTNRSHTARSLSPGRSYTVTLKSGSRTRIARCSTSSASTTTRPTTTTTTTRRPTTTVRAPAPVSTWRPLMPSYTPTYATTPRTTTSWRPLMPSYTPTYATTPDYDTDWEPLMPDYTPTYATNLRHDSDWKPLMPSYSYASVYASNGVSSSRQGEEPTVSLRQEEGTTATPTYVPTGITGNTTLDYLFFPSLILFSVSLIFRKQIVAMAKRAESVRREVRAEW